MITKTFGIKALLALLLLGGGLLGGCTQATQTVEQKYMFWPPQPDLPHIQYLTSIASTADVTGKQSKMEDMVYGKELGSDLPFQRPYGLRMIDGKVFVCDASAANVTVLDFRKKEVRILGQSGQVTLLKPIDIALAPDGMKYVADTGHGAIIGFDANDKYAGRILLPKLRPVSVAVWQNELYVSDMQACKVRVFDRFNGKELRSFGKSGVGPGELGLAMGLALDDQGNIYVNDVLGCHVQKFTHEGKFISMIGGIGDLPGTFVRPKHMAVDSSGILYVVDNAFQNVQMFNEKGEMLMFFGSAGRHPGAMDAPTGICVDEADVDLFAKYVHPAFQAQRLVLVTNNIGPYKISVYALGELKPGKTLADIASTRVMKVVGFSNEPAGSTTLGTLPEPGLSGPSTAPATQPTSAPATMPTSAPAGK